MESLPAVTRRQFIGAAGTLTVGATLGGCSLTGAPPAPMPSPSPLPDELGLRLLSRTTFGPTAFEFAQLAKADVGLEVACVDLGGWDTHADQGPTDGELNNLMTRFAEGLSAFYTDMADRLDRTTLVVMSEFGRRVAENASRGTDHGHGNAMFVLGGHVNGGQVIADWPGLDRDQLDEERDLRITTDYRDVLAEILQKRAASTALADVFPDFTPKFRDALT